MRALPLALLLLSGCAHLRTDLPGPDCVTPCGVTIYGTGHCDQVSALERRALDAYEHHVGWSRDQLCQALHGWQAWMVGELGVGQQRYGAVTLRRGQVVLVADPQSVVHEIAHVAEWLLDGRDKPNPEHERWEERGVNAAIRAAKGP